MGMQEGGGCARTGVDDWTKEGDWSFGAGGVYIIMQ